LDQINEKAVGYWSS